MAVAGKITNTSVNWYLLKLDECVTFLDLRFRYSTSISCFLFAYILFIHPRPDDPSLEMPTNRFVFNTGMFGLDSRCTGKSNTAPTCHNRDNLCPCHCCAEMPQNPGHDPGLGMPPFLNTDNKHPLSGMLEGHGTRGWDRRKSFSRGTGRECIQNLPFCIIRLLKHVYP